MIQFIPMKKYDQRSIISSIQKNLKSMREEAQNYLRKHQNSNLPPICKARHYLMHSFANSNQADLSPLFSPSSAEKPLQTASSPKANVCQLEFSPQKAYMIQKPETNSMRSTIMNSTTLRLRMSNRWKGGSQSRTQRNSEILNDTSRDKMKTIIMNSDSVANKNYSSTKTNPFKSKTLRTQIPKKQLEAFNRYMKPKDSDQKFSKYAEELEDQIKAEQQKVQREPVYSRTLDLQLTSNELDQLSKELLDSRIKFTESNIRKRQRKSSSRKSFVNESVQEIHQKKKKRISQIIYPSSTKSRKYQQKEEVDYTPWAHQTNDDDFPIV